MPQTALIDLTTRHIEISPTPELLVRAFLGGRGPNIHYLRKHLRQAGDPRHIDPFDPANPLIFG
ncbi:MAG: hypothetical protein HYZ35_08345, partial [Chloroflexi bacterium]|nr:hypothetical protein [Chloroflexota bacterium]